MQDINLLGERDIWLERLRRSGTRYIKPIALSMALLSLGFLIAKNRSQALPLPPQTEINTAETPDPFLLLSSEVKYLGYFQQGAHILGIVRLPNQRVIRVEVHAPLGIQDASVQAITQKHLVLQNPKQQEVMIPFISPN